MDKSSNFGLSWRGIMKSSKAAVLAASFLLLFAFWLFLAGQERAGPAPVSGKEGESLIRKELFHQTSPERGLPRRNIFSPRSSSGPFGSSAVQIPGQTQAELSLGEEASAEEKTRPPEFSLALRYIGYIVSARQTIGLIFLDGQAQAVAEGEVIREGIRVGKITSVEIEVIFPDSTTKKFPLEGE